MKEFSEDEISSVLATQRPDEILVLDFWAPWCGPCRMMAPIFEQAAARLGSDKISFGKINTDEAPGFAGGVGIRSIPTLMVFRGGAPIAATAGLTDIEGIAELIEKATA